MYKNIILLDLKKSFSLLLKKHNIRFLFYKGAFTAETVYNSIEDRFLSDIDILIDENDLTKVKKIIDENFKILKYKKDKSFYTNEYRFYENELLLNYKEHEISLDLHIGFVQKSKFNIDYSIILKKDLIEHQLIALIIQVSNDYFIKVEQKFLDLYLILTAEDINWNYLLNLISQFKIKKISYLTFYILINELNLKNIPIDKINLSKQEKLILNNMFVTDIFRVNQILLFYYTFDNISDYSRFLNDKLIKIKHNGIKEVVKSFKKIK